MSNAELIQMAAKAIGGVFDHLSGAITFDGGFEYTQWEPLEDDGDALRLANSLGLTIGQSYEAAYVDLCSGEILQRMKGGCQHEVNWRECDGDKNLACRRAIVMAAAQIGSVMP